MANLNGGNLMRRKAQANQATNAQFQGSSAANQFGGYNQGIPVQPPNPMMNSPGQPNMPIPQGPQQLGGNPPNAINQPNSMMMNSPGQPNIPLPQGPQQLGGNPPNAINQPFPSPSPGMNLPPGAQPGFQQLPGGIGPNAQLNLPTIPQSNPNQNMPNLTGGSPSPIPNLPPQISSNTPNMPNTPNLPNLPNQLMPGQAPQPMGNAPAIPGQGPNIPAFPHQAGSMGGPPNIPNLPNQQIPGQTPQTNMNPPAMPAQIPNLPPPPPIPQVGGMPGNMAGAPSIPQVPRGQMPGQMGMPPQLPNGISQPPMAQNMSTSIGVPCSSEIATQLMNTGIQQQLITQFGLQKVTYNNGSFELSGLNNAKVMEAQQSLFEVIGNFSNKSGDKPQWAWMTDDGSFSPYDHITAQIIEAAYLRKAPMVMITISGSQYRIEFGNPHKQILPQSDIARTVRRIAKGEEDQINIVQPGDVMWFWQDDDKKFKPYTAEASRLIEHASKQGLNSALIPGHNGKGYMIDFNNMTQINEKTQYKRAIKRGAP